VFSPSAQLTSPMLSIQHTILLTDIGTGDFLPTQEESVRITRSLENACHGLRNEK
jgi:hypothetical protein